MRYPLIALAALFVVTPAIAQSGPPSAPARRANRSQSWVTRLGRDTVAFERYMRTAERLEGDYVTTAPRTRIVHYNVLFNDDGTVRQYEYSARPAVEAPGVPGPVRAVATPSEGGFRVITTRPDKTDTTLFAAGRDAVPSAFYYSWGLFELTTMTAARRGGDSSLVEQLPLGGRQVNRVAVVRKGDSVAVDFFGSPMMVTTGNDGRILGVSGARTTAKVSAAPALHINLANMVEMFAARDRAGQSVGLLSSRDTVQATIGDAELWIDYGRPAKRGRQVWGVVVPFGQVWRTGANAATQFRTNKDLVIGTVTVPAGTYTLFSLPTKGGARLIINKQNGQWGTEYHAEQDLGRVAVGVRPLKTSVERFTITVTGQGRRGELRMEWDRTRWAVPFRVKS